MARRKKRKPYRSRLARRESRKMMGQSLFFLLLTGGIIFGLFKWGLPALVQLAGFLGDINSSSEPIENVDTIAPYTPVLDIGFEATTSAEISVRGYGESGTSILLFNNGMKVGEALADQEGEFEILDVRLKDGPNELKAQAIDEAGNESPLSQSRFIDYDETAPEVVITTPTLIGDKFETDEQILEIEGKSDIGARVFVNDRLARLGSGGEFSSSVSLNEGENTITLKAVDKAGNESVEEFKVTYWQ